jgi:FtsZ-binding cell division protein ZapB
MTQEEIALMKALLPEAAHEKLTETATADDVKGLMPEYFVEKTFAEQQLKEGIGKRMGALETKLRRIVGEDGKGKNVDDLLPLVETRYQSLQTELDEAKKGGGDTSQIKAELEQIKKDRDAYKELSEKANTERDEWKEKAEAAEGKILTVREQIELDNAVNSHWNGLNWIDGASDYLKSGIWSKEVEGKVTFKKEGGKVIVYDMEGNMLTNGTGAMYADAFFAQLAEKASALKKNGAPPAGTPPAGNPKSTRFERLQAKRVEGQNQLISNIISKGGS